MANVLVEETHLAAIGDALREKTGTEERYKPAQMAPAISRLKTAGRMTMPFDPEEAYRATRPMDWLNMPEPEEDEMYMLFHVPDGGSALLAFTVTCESTYTVELGTAQDSDFVPRSSVSLGSGVAFETEIAAEDAGDLTSLGMKQVMVRVKAKSLSTWRPAQHSKMDRTIPLNIVEISCDTPTATELRVRSNEECVMDHLTYFSCKRHHITNMSYMFDFCAGLVCVRRLNTAGVTDMEAQFQSCSALVAIPWMDTSSVWDMSYRFSGCAALRAIPEMDTSNVTKAEYMLNSCTQLRSVPALDLRKAVRAEYLFGDCFSLTTIQRLALGDASMGYDAFSNCRSLGRFELNPTVTDLKGVELLLENCAMGHAALVALLNSLPTIAQPHTLTLTGNPGVDELTEEEKAIAINKNWALEL